MSIACLEDRLCAECRSVLDRIKELLKNELGFREVKCWSSPFEGTKHPDLIFFIHRDFRAEVHVIGLEKTCPRKPPDGGTSKGTLVKEEAFKQLLGSQATGKLKTSIRGKGLSAH